MDFPLPLTPPILAGEYFTGPADSDLLAFLQDLFPPLPDVEHIDLKENPIQLNENPKSTIDTSIDENLQNIKDLERFNLWFKCIFDCNFYDVSLPPPSTPPTKKQCTRPPPIKKRKHRIII